MMGVLQNWVIYTTYLGEYLALQDEEAVVVQVDAAALEQLRHLETQNIRGFRFKTLP
jgi:hypothetical protein